MTHLLAASPLLWAPVLWAALAASAHAADLDSHLVPGAPLTAGEAGVVEVLIPGVPTDTRLRARAEGARTGAVERVHGDLFAVAVEPRAAGEVRLDLSARLEGEPSEGSVVVPVAPRWAGPLDVQPAVDAVDVGARSPVEITLTPGGDSPQPLGERQLMVRPSTGKLAAPAVEGDGWRLTWTAPRRLDAPAFAILGVVDAGAPTTVAGWATVAVRVPTPVSFEVPAGASCVLQAGDTTVEGTADASGVLALTVPLHPGVARGDLSCPTQGLHRAVGLPAGRDPWVSLLPAPPRVPAGQPVPLLAAVVEDDGRPRETGTLPRFEVSAGEVRDAEWVAPGLAVVTWVPPTTPGKATLTATLRERSDRATIEVVAADRPGALVPHRLVAWTDGAAEGAAEGATVPVRIAALDATGLPLAGVSVAVEASGGTAARTSVRTGSDGTATVDLRPADDAPLASLTARVGGLRASAARLPDGALPAGTGSATARAWRDVMADAPDAVRPGVPAPSRDALVAPATPGADLAAAAGLSRETGPTPWARMSLSVATVPHAYRQTSQDDGGMVGSVDSTQGDLLGLDPVGAPALDLRGHLFPGGGRFGVDVRLQGRGEAYDAQGATYERLDLQAAAGLRVALVDADEDSPLDLDLLAQAEYFRVPLFRYETFRADDPDKAVGAVLFGTDVVGGRLGVATRRQWGPLGVEAEVSETFAPYPVHSRVGAGVDYEVHELVALRAGLDLGFRHLTFDLDTDVAKVRDQQHMASLGFTVLLR